MRYYIPAISSFVNEYEQFEVEGITYPRGWLTHQTNVNDIGAVPAPSVPAGKKLAEDPSGWQLVDLTQEEIDAAAAQRKVSAISTAWLTCDDRARSGADDNSRAKYLMWYVRGDTSAECKARIEAVDAWMDSIWAVYKQFLVDIESDPEAVLGALPEEGSCPYNFWEVEAALSL